MDGNEESGVCNLGGERRIGGGFHPGAGIEHQAGPGVGRPESKHARVLARLPGRSDVPSKRLGVQREEQAPGDRRSGDQYCRHAQQQGSPAHSGTGRLRLRSNDSLDT